MAKQKKLIRGTGKHHVKHTRFAEKSRSSAGKASLSGTRKRTGEAKPSDKNETAPIPTNTPEINIVKPNPAGNNVFHGLVIGRRNQARLEIRLGFGSITDVFSKVYVLGVFKDVAPSGAAHAIDQQLEGMLAEFTERRMFSGQMGEVFVLPSGGHNLRANMVLLVGLGDFSSFNDEAQKQVAENVARLVSRTRIDEMAMVLIGAGSGVPTGILMGNLLEGFFRGLRDADSRLRFRSVTIAESNKDRYEEIRKELYQLASGPLFEEVELTVDEIVLPPITESVSLSRGVSIQRAPDPVYLMVQGEGATTGKNLGIRCSVLGAGSRAAVLTSVKQVGKTELEELINNITEAADKSQFDKLDDLGGSLGKLILNPDIIDILASTRDSHLVVVHDENVSRVQWETIRINNWNPATGAGLSRRFLATDLPIARFLSVRRQEPGLRLLLVVNPSQNDPNLNLPGAELEGNRVRAIASANPSIQITELHGADATREALRKEIGSGKYDVVHYAGHAGFTAGTPEKSGLLCSGGDYLTWSDMEGADSLPSLIFFNACQTARTRKAPVDTKNTKKDVASISLAKSASLAEALLRSGVANFLGTYWEVGDESAMKFAESLYSELLKGNILGNAINKGRKIVREEVKSVDWADYILYGSYDFVLKVAAKAK